ncbi:C40 family peptidase [Marivirga arenosa]|uniref:C40 family peptidase n=1 Tax=Marivirga arenosa TaxID=3059076 RepID=A0AA51N573_9BACT|nr:C40 family peptidase [Marivirga sp. ABR2-2]WMN06429.1 C40 family peptidase [Marivirga sp. ABR2-2]
MTSIGQKGISRLSIIPVRAEPSDAAEMVTQLLFGDHYSVIDISKDQKWVKIEIYFDHYQGWIDSKQFHYISEEYFDQINNSDYKICTDLTASILYQKNLISVTLGSVIPISTNEIFAIEEHLGFNGEAKSLSAKRDFEYLKGVVKKYLNAPYLWGGKSPFGIDCSGFTQMVFKICGYNLKRDASQQVQQGKLVDGLVNALPGDLAFFRNEDKKVTHVGILLENQEIIHASGRVKIDFLDENGIFNAEQKGYTHYLTDIKRILA